MLGTIVISSHKRLPLLQRTLFGIVTRVPKDIELVVVDDCKEEDVFPILRQFTSRIKYTLIRVDNSQFEEETGVKHFFNCSALTYNVGFKHAHGDLIFMQGNEVIPWDGCYARMLEDTKGFWEGQIGSDPVGDYWMVMSTTYDVPNEIVQVLDPYGSNLSQKMVDYCKQWPLQSRDYRSDVTNYISLTPRALWEEIDGIDERYMGGISSEDSDFVRRARCLPGFDMMISEGISLHQFHAGKTKYYNPKPSVITQERFREGVEINHAIYHSWDGSQKNGQSWPWGEIGITDLMRNWTPRKELI